MFEKMMPGQVALCTVLMAYRPEGSFGQSNIVVGTPNALESALSKVPTAPDFRRISLKAPSPGAGVLACDCARLPLAPPRITPFFKPITIHLLF
jgi:hypothetical protein